MTHAKIHHFLVVYDIVGAIAEIQSFGPDYESAVRAYTDVERENRDDENIEVVLLGSDSIDTLQRTHSSYFALHEKHADQIVARELAQLGFR